MNSLFIYELCEPGPVNATSRHMGEITERRAGGIVYLERPGPGPTLICLHGIGSNARSFVPLLETLPKTYRLLAWNAPGYSGSDALQELWPFAEDYAQAVASWLDAIGAGPVMVLGHSLGTLVATAFARAEPGRVQRLVLAAAAQGYGVPRGSALPARAAERIDDLRRLGPAAFAAARAPNLVHAPDQNPDVVRAVADAMAGVDPDGYAQAVHMLASGDLSSELARVAVTPAFILGSHDTVTPAAQTDRAAAAWAAAHGHTPERIVIEKAGHAVYLQRPAAFATALCALLTAGPQPDPTALYAQAGEPHDT